LQSRTFRILHKKENVNMKVSIGVAACPRPGTWARVMIIAIITAAAWAGYGPAAVTAVLAGGGLASCRLASCRLVTRAPR
jgi:hypothetical protein